MLRSNLTRSVRTVTVGNVIIGDEILKGYIKETNSSYLAKKLFPSGIKLERVIVLPDDEQAIADCVADFSTRFDIVITSGGIGPTHDDITFQSVARAFGEECIVHPELFKVVNEYFGTVTPESPHMKLCTVPQSTKLVYDGCNGKKFKYPVVSVNNVYILPGIPQLFERTINNLVGFWASRKWDNDSSKPNLYFKFLSILCQYFVIPSSAPRTTRELHLTCLETDVADKLTAASKLYSDVNIGSYPSWINNYSRVLITMDSTNEQQLTDCNNRLINEIGHEHIINYDLNLRPWMLNGEDVLQLSQEESDLGKKVKESMRYVEVSISCIP